MSSARDSDDILCSVTGGGIAPELGPAEMWSESLEKLNSTLERETHERRRAECMAHIQSEAVQLALNLLVREPDIESFFRVLLASLVDDTESHSCGVWLLDEDDSCCKLWMTSPEFDPKTIPVDAIAAHLLSNKEGWTQTSEYKGDDERLPESVRAFNDSIGVRSFAIAPLALPTRNLGWMALSTGDNHPEWAPWRRATLEAIARQATLALHHSRIAEQSLEEARRQAVLEERNRIARDIHDTLAQGFAAILMQLQSVQRWASGASLPPAVAQSIDTAVDLARTHMIEARRSVGALRPQAIEAGDFAAVLTRTIELARRTTDVPIDLQIDDMPELGAGVEREIIGIAQEALTNAVRHARAKRIVIHAASPRSVGFRLSIADDGKGIAKERFGAGFGMTSMQERADRIGGSLTIVTAPRAGTEVVLAWEPPAFSIPGTSA